MRAAVTVGSGLVRIDHVADPLDTAASLGQVVVSVDSVGLCGTDIHIWDGSYPAGRLPMVQGHEIVGRVAAVPDGCATTLRRGTPVVVDPALSCGRCHACRVGRTNACAQMAVLGVHSDGGLCERIAVSPERLHRIADTAVALGPLVEPTQISLQAVARSRAESGEYATVLGCGPIGLLAMLALRDLGVEVAAVDVHPERLSHAERLGVPVCLLAPDRRLPFEVIRSWSRGEGPAVVIEATGSAQALTDAVEVVAAAGRVVAVGISGSTVHLPMLSIPYKELDLLGSRNSTGLFPAAVDFVDRHAAELAPLITHRFDLTDLGRAFALLSGPDATVCKAVIDISTP